MRIFGSVQPKSCGTILHTGTLIPLCLIMLPSISYQYAQSTYEVVYSQRPKINDNKCVVFVDQLAVIIPAPRKLHKVSGVTFALLTTLNRRTTYPLTHFLQRNQRYSTIIFQYAAMKTIKSYALELNFFKNFFIPNLPE